MAVLSIQSHVAYGHAGNAAAVLPLQCLGHEVWPVMTAQLAFHTGHGPARGQVFDPDALRAVIDGIAEIDALKHCAAVLSGYMASSRLVAVVAETVGRVKAANPEALYCCDPVMGDRGRGLYVAEEIPAFIADILLPAADIVTPNLFELERLSGRTVASERGALDALRAVMAHGPELGVVTSLRFGEDGRIGMLAATADEAYVVEAPYKALDFIPGGAGDVTAALLLGHLLRGRGLEESLGLTAASLADLFAHAADGLAGELPIVGRRACFDEAAALPVRRLS